MTKNPLLNALAASLYIALVGGFMYLVSDNAPQADTIVMPIAAISLFTLSAAVMGYMFCYQPALMVVGGNAKRGLDIFLKTVLIFAAVTGLLFVAVLLG